MDREKSSNHGGGFLPPSGRYSAFPSPGSSFNVKAEPSGSTKLPPLGNVSSGGADSSMFSYDISRMPDKPKNLGHRRAHSEILTLPDDINFDSDLGIVGGLDGPSFSDDTEDDFFSMYLDMDKFNSSSATSGYQLGASSSLAAATSGSLPNEAVAHMDVAHTISDKPRIRHQHSQSMDGSTTMKSEMLTSSGDEPTSADAKKAISAAKLAELALIDPKRAKRVWANRQSAARSKERKMRYIAELERKVQALQTEATSLSAQLTLLQRDSNGLTAENSELKLRLQTMEQQVHLQDALNDALKEEIQHLKVLTGQMANGGPVLNYPPSFGGNQQFYSNRQAMHNLLTAQQFQQLQISSQKQPQHQFQQHQLHHQLQQQQQNQQAQSMMQQREQLQRQSADIKLRGSVQSLGQNDNASDIGGKDPK
ncbi:hypothetical protein LIER_19402 [Lithospermum erythrorhizon]|uniref:BZIP domain-containing protein n=1 Tax=Lithospermum erythrorhizon TaxID=34254 RepID=A0AAV3QN81_LITER